MALAVENMQVVMEAAASRLFLLRPGSRAAEQGFRSRSFVQFMLQENIINVLTIFLQNKPTKQAATGQQQKSSSWPV